MSLPTLLVAALCVVDPPMLLLDADVRTLDRAAPRASAIAIAGGRILAVGDETDCRAAAGADAVVVDCGGRPLLRGFYDAHAHLMRGGMALAELDLRGARSVEELIARLSAYADEAPPGEWLLGRGFDQTLFDDRVWPTRHDLDFSTPNTPVLLMRVDGHSAVANSAALREADIGATTPDPPGGIIERDEIGEPTGVLKETAVELVSSRIPPASYAKKLDGARRGLALAREYGITSIVDHGGDPDAYLELLKNGELSARIELWCDLGDDLQPWIELRDRIAPHRDHLRFDTLKGFVDGTFGSRTAAMFEGFEDDAASTGVVVTEPEKLFARVAAADAAGFRVALHAIGDRAVAIALDAFERAAKANGTTGRRHRIEHAQVLRREDVARFAALGVTASMQPCHLLTDRRFALERLGDVRIENAYPWRSLLDAGATLAFGTDFPVEPLDPMRNLFAALTRGDADQLSAEPLVPQERIALDEALFAMTAGGAHAAGREAELGPLVPGSLADVVVLDRAIDPANGKQILETRAWLVVVGGKVVHSTR
jgi:predicted amidohydrolase YtcJ